MKPLKIFKQAEWVRNITKLPFWRKYALSEWILLIVGALFIFYLLLNIFTSLGDKTPLPRVGDTVSFREMDAFEEILSATINSSIENLGNITILTNGDEFLSDLLSEIDRAERTINITNYIWDDGEFGNTLFEALIEKQKEGVEVRVLLDGIGGRKANEELIDELSQSGGTVAYFRPVRWWNVNRMNRRNHVRDIVIDGRITYFGGVAISDLWLGNADTPKSWHDFMFKMDGTAAVRGQKIFSSMWSQVTGEMLRNVSPYGEAGVVRSSSNFIPFLSVPSPDMSHHMEYFLWLSIQAADTFIYIENPYILPSKAIREALKEKARAGVDVRIIVPSEKIDAKHVRWASQSFYKELLESGIRIFEYEPSRTHAKIIVMDNIWSIIGSANMDNRSREINLELVLGIRDEAFAQDLREAFEEDLGRSKEVTREEWDNVSVLRRPFMLLSRLFIEQY